MMESTDYARVNKDPFREQSTTYSMDWDESSRDEDLKKEKPQSPWATRFNLFRQRTEPIVRTIPPFFKETAGLTLKKMRHKRKQLLALFLLASFGVAPFFILWVPYMHGSEFSDRPRTPFSKKTISCGEEWGQTQNSTVSGIEGLFTLDAVSGHMSFAQAKIVDVVWDVCVGRGAQLIAWSISYVVFTNALLRTIERHPAPYRTFTQMALNGPSFGSMGALVRDLRKHQSRRTTWLFIFMIIGSLYVLFMPIILGAMTGYVSTGIPYVTPSDSSQQIISAADFEISEIVYDGSKIGLKDNGCIDEGLDLSDWQLLVDYRQRYCDCKLPNGTLVNGLDWYDSFDGYGYDYYNYFPHGNLTVDSCQYNFTGQTQMFNRSQYNLTTHALYNISYPCNVTGFNLTVNNHNYSISSLNYTTGWCYNGTGYTSDYLMDHSRCMPDTDNPTYQWGFSTMLSAVFVLLQIIWAIAMYVVWQDAQLHSELVKRGYAMSQLRAAFTVATAAQGKTGLEPTELMRADTKGLERDLYGQRKGKKKEAEVTFDMFTNELPRTSIGLRERTSRGVE